MHISKSEVAFADMQKMIKEKTMKNIKNTIIALSLLLSAQGGLLAITEAQYELYEIAGKRDSKTLQQFLENKKPDVNFQEVNGSTPLIQAIVSDTQNEPIRYQKIQLLLEAKANPNIADFTGMTPLMYAAERGLRGTVEQLLFHGADRTVIDYRGRTAVDLAKTDEIKQILSK